jgi:hypothetical protein
VDQKAKLLLPGSQRPRCGKGEHPGMGMLIGDDEQVQR